MAAAETVSCDDTGRSHLIWELSRETLDKRAVRRDGRNGGDGSGDSRGEFGSLMETDGFQGEGRGHDCGGDRRKGEGGDGRGRGGSSSDDGSWSPDVLGDGRGKAGGKGKEDDEEDKEEIHLRRCA